MLAERARTPLLVAAVATASLAIVAAVAPCSRAARTPTPSIIIESVESVGPSVEISDYCPPHVRAAIHLGNDAMLYCVRGQYPEPGTFVFALYRTTELWERFAVVADDGQLIVPMLDRPHR